MPEDTAAFRGEDESAGEASPALDLIASGFLFALGLFFAALSLALPVPGGLVSAPGLLPFVVSASLAVMAIVLGLSAWRRRVFVAPLQVEIDSEIARRIAAAGAVAVYLAALQTLSLEGFVAILGRQIPIGGFEPATIVFLTALLRLFWTDRLAAVVTVSVGWTLCLSFAFRGLFGVPLPG
ncbi:tripartite tricarboxylate transporter TctB family protein [Marivita hallyeonensis]|uniref:Tripartite tricarboxylate transporter TctB family protein n=1 Tax=Marivita hallyeonensis TaxID=996342 RepID=A0A1M5N149_9RHOB|nr:tripartite tricarboxylate transporter TctB family protein [Marivita hallyeonensis]SHG83284.1 Tripartite tricarboxylate transporter TctB family protein [Marivita hallyeonensis]